MLTGLTYRSVALRASECWAYTKTPAMRSRYCSRIFVRKAPRRETHQLKEGHAPRYSGTIAACENVRTIDENDHAFRKLPGAKFVHCSRGIQIALPGKNARRSEAVSALLKELNAILDFHVPLTPPYPTQACKRRVAAELRQTGAARDTPAS